MFGLILDEYADDEGRGVQIILYCCAAVLSLGRLVNPVTAAMLADAVSERDRAFCFPVRAFSCQRRMSAQRLRPLSAATLQILQAVAQAGPLVGYGIGDLCTRGST